MVGTPYGELYALFLFILRNFLWKMFGELKIISTFASLSKESWLMTLWRDGRVVDCGGLENR